MQPYPQGYGYGNQIGVFYPTTIASSGTNIVIQPQFTDWQASAVKATPDDEFTWLRRSVKEIEDLAFA